MTILNPINIKTVFFALLIFLSFPSGSEEASWPFPVESVEDAVFMFEFFNPGDYKLGSVNGTAFIIELKGRTYLVTNFHIAENFLIEKIDWKITNRKGRVINKQDIEGLSRLSFLYDLAVFKIKKKRYKGLVLKANNRTENNETAYMMGFPRKQFIKIKLSNVSELYPGHFSGFIENGSAVTNGISGLGGTSGGPVFNNKGKVIGVMAKGNKTEAQFIGFHFVNNALRTNKTYGNIESWARSEVKMVKELAAKGDPFAQFVLANQYYRQYQSTLNKNHIPSLLIYCEKSAAQGHLDAQIMLGILYIHGESMGIPKNLEKGKKWLRLAVKQNKSITADFQLALALTTEENSNRNFAEGWDLLRELDKKGVRPSSEYLRQLQRAYGLRVLNDRSMTSTETGEEGCTNGLFR